jgi:hypothetical protein
MRGDGFELSHRIDLLHSWYRNDNRSIESDVDKLPVLDDERIAVK